MARQVPSTEVAQDALKKHCSYYSWLCMQSGIDGPLARLFYETDFRWSDTVPDDENRAKEAKELRTQYAIYLLAKDEMDTVLSKEQWHDVDLLKKSILGPACVFEVLVCIARDLDSMLNMGAESCVKTYFERLMMNVGFDFYDEEDWDTDSEKVEKYWKKLMDRWLDRSYLSDGEGGLFPLNSPDTDQVQRSLWSQMNDWVDQEMVISGGEFE